MTEPCQHMNPAVTTTVSREHDDDQDVDYIAGNTTVTCTDCDETLQATAFSFQVIPGAQPGI